ncbi:hypothetical protein [Caulobacter sp.]|uniref:hypothetical protein n=1 Tax=Caulobacter sp. TaxID=78 RepID=UPI003BB1FF07
MSAARAIALGIGAAVLGGLVGAAFTSVLAMAQAQLAGSLAFIGLFAFGFAVAGGTRS